MFLFVPHRGSRLAANSLGALAVRLIRLPDALLTEAEHAANQLAGLESRRIPTSIHGLSPRSLFLRALSNTTPVVPVHSIIGNRGRGDGSAGSDGVVPVRSARVVSAESELIVPTGHGGFDHPAAVAEIRHIILMDVAQQQRSAAAQGQADDPGLGGLNRSGGTQRRREPPFADPATMRYLMIRNGDQTAARRGRRVADRDRLE